MFVDMLNYGAASQKLFKYNTENLANADIGAYQNLGTQAVTYKDSRVKGSMYYATSLSTEANLSMNLYFTNVTDGMYAEVSYVDHYGHQKTARVEAAQFVSHGKNLKGVSINTLVIADMRQIVTCKLYSADGTEIGSVQDSIESYVARMAAKDPFYETVMKFGVSSYDFFHK